jgi:hypothetical protein
MVQEAMPGQKEGGGGGQPPALGDGTPASPTVVRHKAGRALSKADDCESDSMDEDDDDDEDEDDDDDSVEEEVFAHPGEGEGSRRHNQHQKQPQQQQMRLPVETERWVMESAPTRDQQQARQAQEVWAQLQQNFSLLSLSSSLRGGPPM